MGRACSKEKREGKNKKSSGIELLINSRCELNISGSLKGENCLKETSFNEKVRAHLGD